MTARLRLVLLDRDGTTVAPAPPGQRYLERPGDVRLLPGVPDAVRGLNLAGIKVAVVTNQRCIATGVVPARTVEAINARIDSLLAPDAWIDAWFVCPHDAGQCQCRKPAPGLVTAALEHFGVAPDEAGIIGDAQSDLDAGRAAGVCAVGVGSGAAGSADAWEPSLAAALQLLRALTRRSRGPVPIPKQILKPRAGADTAPRVPLPFGEPSFTVTGRWI